MGLADHLCTKKNSRDDLEYVRRLQTGSSVFISKYYQKRKLTSQSGWLPMWKNIVETNIMVCPVPLGISTVCDTVYSDKHPC
jgi:hypothetical protein